MDPKNSQKFFQQVQIEYLIHELKTPISVIETGLRTLLEKKDKYGALTPRQEKTLRRSLRNSKKAREMLFDLLEIGRTEAGCIECSFFLPAQSVYETLLDCIESSSTDIFDFCAACDNQKDVFTVLSDNGIFLDIDSRLLNREMYQDEVKFRQIVGNLIKNALHHRKKRLEIWLRPDEDRLKIDVSDDGRGIAPAHHELIFQRYAQAPQSHNSPLQRKGHGLGLAGSLILARHLGGDIQIKSDKENGATFRLTLPFSGNADVGI